MRTHHSHLRRRFLLTCTGLLLAACAGARGPAAGPAAAVEPDAEQVTAQGLTVTRPGKDWRFVQPDATVGKDTVVLLQGQAGEKAVAPVVEIARRPLSAADQRRRAADILASTAAELMQTFEAFAGVSAPADTEVAGRPAARMDARFTEMFPDGASVARTARLYALRSGADLWLVRCFGPSDDSADADFDAIVRSLSLRD